MEENKYILPAAIIIAGALIGWGFYSNSNEEKTASNNQEQEVVTENENKEQVIPEIDFREDDHILGKPNAKIRIITFNDLECPYCDLFHQTMEQVIEEYGKDGKVAWAIRQFPVHGEPTQIKAAATECAGLLQNETAFWEMTTEIFKPEEDESWMTVEKVYTLAEEMGMEEQAFKDCLENPDILNKIQKDFDKAVELGATGTPFSVVILPNGEKFPIEGAQPFDSMKNMIELILSEM